MSNDPIDTTSCDELLLIGYLLGRSSPEEAEEVRRRLDSDVALRQRKLSLENTFAAIRLLPEAECPADLTARALDRVARERRTQAAVARRETARPWIGGTFSMRELLAVAASVLLIVSVLVPSLRQVRNTAIRNQCASNTGQVGAAINIYANQNGERLPAAMDQKAQWLASASQAPVSNSQSLYKLVSAGMVPPSAFQCPAVGRASFTPQRGMTDFPGGQYIHYSYQHSLPPEGPIRRDQYSPNEAEGMVIYVDQSPLFAGGRFRPEGVGATSSANHGDAGQNVLYLNSSVRWTNEANVGLNGDNIFLAGSLVNYVGDEQPKNHKDSFMLPAYAKETDGPAKKD